MVYNEPAGEFAKVGLGCGGYRVRYGPAELPDSHRGGRCFSNVVRKVLVPPAAAGLRELGLTAMGTLGVLDATATRGLVELPAMFAQLRETTFRMLEQDLLISLVRNSRRGNPAGRGKLSAFNCGPVNAS